jgi:hypothetical protein
VLLESEPSSLSSTIYTKQKKKKKKCVRLRVLSYCFLKSGGGGGGAVIFNHQFSFTFEQVMYFKNDFEFETTMRNQS